MKKWTNEEIEKAKSLLADGFRYEEIGIKLDRTRGSIKGKLEKIGIKFYQLNPITEKRKCLNCNIEFEAKKVEPNKFCGSSCSASYNNKRKIKKTRTDINKRKRKEYHKKKKKECINCKTITTNKYCGPKCQHQYKRNKIFQEIENGNVSLSFIKYKQYLIEKYGEKCMKCGWAEVNLTSGKIPIELEHKDGNSDNHLLSNLELLCPNCHSLTSTYKSLNKGNGRKKRLQRYHEKDKFYLNMHEEQNIN